MTAEEGRRSLARAARTLGVEPARLRSWLRLVRPEGGSGPLTFREMVALRSLVALRAAGLRGGRLAWAVRRLRRSLPAVPASLASLRLRLEGREVVVDLGERRMTAGGQLLLDLEREEPRAEVLRLDRGGKPSRSLAASLAVAHCELAEKLLAAGEPMAAEDELRRALLFGGGSRRVYLLLAEVYESLGCPRKAAAARQAAAREGDA